MKRTIRVLLLDLLVERSEFGHGGNQEVIHPIAEFGNVDVFLLTPQMQSLDSGGKAEIKDYSSLIVAMFQNGTMNTNFGEVAK